MVAIIYSKLLCPYCEMAKKLLEKEKVTYKEIIIGVDLTKKEAFEELDTTFTTVPQIVVDGIHIGGYTELVEFFKRLQQQNGEPK